MISIIKRFLGKGQPRQSAEHHYEFLPAHLALAHKLSNLTSKAAS